MKIPAVRICLLLGLLLVACGRPIAPEEAPTTAVAFPSPTPGTVLRMDSPLPPTDTQIPPTPTFTPVPPTSTPATPSLGDTWTRPADDMTMVYIPATEFEMGSDDDEVDHALQLCDEYINCERWWFEREQPVH
ncbi:MAG: hypothetical protein JSV36_19175, partial [Anaerolineae bacterium]